MSFRINFFQNSKQHKWNFKIPIIIYHTEFPFLLSPLGSSNVSKYYISFQHLYLSSLFFMKSNIGIILEFLKHLFLQWFCYISQQRGVLSLIEEHASLENYFPGDSSMPAPSPPRLRVKKLASFVWMFWIYILYLLAHIYFLLKFDLIKCGFSTASCPTSL